MNEEINKLIEEFEARLQEIKVKYNEHEREFKIGEPSYFIDGYSVFYKKCDGSSYERELLMTENLFKTKEDAIFEIEKRKVLHELKQLGRPFKPKWSNFSICLLHDSRDNQKKLFYKLMTEVEHVYGDYYFDSIPKAKDAVYRIGEERILKYLFRVED